MTDINLPPLPDVLSCDPRINGQLVHHIRSYARAAVEADRQQREGWSAEQERAFAAGYENGAADRQRGGADAPREVLLDKSLRQYAHECRIKTCGAWSDVRDPNGDINEVKCELAHAQERRLESAINELADLACAVLADRQRGEPVNPAPGYCPHCKQYTIAEPLYAAPPIQWAPQQQDPPEHCTIAATIGDSSVTSQPFDEGRAGCVAAESAPPIDPAEVMPDPALIDSMALRYRHDFGLLDQREQDSIRTTMRQLWEEVVGKGFYRRKDK